jgi:hypothetical protein
MNNKARLNAHLILPPVILYQRNSMLNIVGVTSRLHSELPTGQPGGRISWCNRLFGSQTLIMNDFNEFPTV